MHALSLPCTRGLVSILGKMRVVAQIFPWNFPRERGGEVINEKEQTLRKKKEA